MVRSIYNQEGEKLCTNCGKFLPTSDFDRRHSFTSTLKPWCRECTNRYKRFKYNQEKIQENSVDWNNIEEILESALVDVTDLAEYPFTITLEHNNVVILSVKNYEDGTKKTKT